MKEVKIQIPDNCELIKDGDTYVVREKEKKDSKPKSWEEFCEEYPINKEEYFIGTFAEISKAPEGDRNPFDDRDVCTSEKEAEAFLALMQLRQLRKAWVGDWKITQGQYAACITNKESDGLVIGDGYFISTRIMMFPNTQMAAEFLVYFKDLLEKAKILL